MTPWLALVGGPFDGAEGTCDLAGVGELWFCWTVPTPTSAGLVLFHAALSESDLDPKQTGGRKLYVLDQFDGGRYVYRYSRATVDEDQKELEGLIAA